MNDRGQIVGFLDSISSRRGFVWSREEGMRVLPHPPGDVELKPHDINNAGLIVGTMGGEVTPFQAFLWDGQQFIELGIPPGGTYSEAYAINEDGLIVGTWGNQGVGNPAYEGFVWQNGVMTRLGPVLGAAQSGAGDVNNVGQIAGAMGVSDSTVWNAFRLKLGAAPLVLPSVPGGQTSAAGAINSGGDMCGGGRTVDPNEPIPYRRGFAWIGGRMFLVPRLPGHRNNFPIDIDRHGVVVGYTFSPNAAGLIWRDGVLTALNELVPLGTHVGTVAAIDRYGRIAANGFDASTHGTMLLTPRTLPGDVNIDCRVDLQDLVILLLDFGCTADCDGDVDQDGDADLTDLAILISNWSP
jgi:probable HAF family extracellular repeat protein